MTNNPARVVVRPLPRLAFFFPAWLVSLTGALFPTEPGDGMGMAWCVIVFINLLLVTGDVTRGRALGGLLTLLAVVVLVVWYGWSGRVWDWAIGVAPVMNRGFYVAHSWSMGALLAWAWLRGRFVYWEFLPHEVVQHEGLFRRARRWPAASLEVAAQTPDVLAGLLLRAGRLVITAASEVHVVEQVLGARGAARRIAQLRADSGAGPR